MSRPIEFEGRPDDERLSAEERAKLGEFSKAFEKLAQLMAEARTVGDCLAIDRMVDGLGEL